MTIGPQPQTFPLFLPLRNIGSDDVSVIVRDAVTRKRLAVYPSPEASYRGGTMTDPSRQFIGVSGNRTTLRALTDALPGAMLQAGYLDPAELPTDLIGYDCLDILLLNAPNLSALSVEQQQAIADWVRGGGNLILWPSEDPVPAAGPLVDLLPCRIGDSTVIEHSMDALEKAGLSRRFGKLNARQLIANPGAQAVPLLGSDKVIAWRDRAAFGRVVVSPIYRNALVFNDAKSTWKLWRPVLQGMVYKLPTDAEIVALPKNYYGVSQTALRESGAIREIGDLLGDVPGAGRFGFGYVAGVMIGMMVIVGPVDWFVLKKLGRQPWTWVTTGGWVALVTLGAVYAGHLFQSGDRHFRTFQLVDQTDGAAVARSDMAALYSPRTAEYDVATPPESWWVPASPGDDYYYRRAVGVDVGFHQTYRGNQPEPMVVNVWNLRFLRGAATMKAGALVDASLRVVDSGDAGKRLVGTVTNSGPTAVKNLAVRTRGGICLFAARAAAADRIEPGKTVNVDAILDPEVRPSDEIDENDPRLRGYYPGYYRSTAQQVDPSRLWDVGANLAIRRTDAVLRWLAERDDLACVYAEVESPDPVAKLSGKPAIERHWKVVRALVPLKR